MRKSLHEAFAVALVIIFFSAPWSDEPARADTDKITVFLGSDKLFIPKDYIRNGVSGAHVSSIWLSVFLPDLIPAQSNLPLFNQLGWNNKMTILFESGRQVRVLQEVADQMLAWAHIDKSNFTQFPNKCRLYKWNMVVAHVLYLCYLPDHLLKVRCWDKEYVKAPSCQVYERLSKNTVVTYSYGIEHEDEIVEIDYKVRNFYKSLLNVQ